MKIEVYENFSGIYNIMGYLNVENIRGHLSTSFEYDKNFIKNKKINFDIDSEIKYYSGMQWTNNKTGMFRIFSDQCPDRWGRKLIEKKEKELINNDKQKTKTLTEIDYLLKVSDMTRMGSFRFKMENHKEYLALNDGEEIPPITDIRKLYEASVEFEKDSDISDWLKQLYYQGSSLGGARPKANVLDDNKELYIAKFHSIKDDYDVEIFEKIIFDLAKMCDINVPDTKIIKVSNRGHIFLSKRFDREKENRIFYMSAMTALAKNDGDRCSYLDIATFIKENSIKPNEDLFELYKRLIFNVIVSNTDDHLRNLAFIYKNGGLCLSPAFDLNINLYGNGLSLDIDENNNDLSFDLVLSTAKYYGIKNEDAKNIINNMKEIVAKNVYLLADKYGVNKEEQKKVFQNLNV